MRRSWFVLQAWVELIYIDLVHWTGLRNLRKVVTGTRVRQRDADPILVQAIVDASVTAGMMYLKQAKCLQRSAAVTRLLRRHGVPAKLIIGSHMPPLKAHAWVEVNGQIVADHQKDLQFYQTLDRW